MILNQGPRFEPLSEDALATLDEGVGRLASEVGVQFDHPRALDLFREAGQTVDGDTVRFDPAFLRAQAALAPREFSMRARDPARDLRIGGDNMIFCPVQGPPFVRIDGERRDGTMADLEQLMRLTQMTDALDTPGRNMLEPNDVPLDSRHLLRALAAIRLTDRVWAGEPSSEAAARDCIRMIEIVHGGLDGDPVLFANVNVNSPLRYDVRMLEGLIAYAEAGQAVIVTPFLLMGAMAPVSVPAALVQQTVEVLAGVALAQLLRPGAPCVMGSFLSSTDIPCPGCGCRNADPGPDDHRRRGRRRRRRADVRARQPGHRRGHRARRRWAARRTSTGPSKRPDGLRGPQGLGELGRGQARPHAREVRGARQAAQRGAGADRDRNIGKAIMSGRGEVVGVSLVLDYYAGAANKVFGETIPVGRPGIELTLREPIGVIGADRAWNFPMYMASWKLGPALAAGNTVVLKPASYVAADRDPPGRAGARGGHPAGRPQRRHRPGRDGRRVDRRASGHRQGRVHGRDDHGAGDHAAGRGEREEDQPRARRQEPEHRLRGRRPREVRARVAVRRVRQLRPGLQRAQPDHRRAVRPRAGRRAVHRRDAKLVVGDPTDDATEVGTLVSTKQRERVAEYVEVGARRRRRRSSPAAGRPTTRRWPTAPTSCRPSSTASRPTCAIVREEIFGPVVSVIPFDTEEEAIRLANDRRTACRARSGAATSAGRCGPRRASAPASLAINSNSSVHIEAPFGGYKLSGIGRELGMHALDLYTETKNIFIDLG